MTETFFQPDPLLVWIPSAWLAALLGHAGLVKLLQRDLFAQHLAAYRVPARWLPLAQWALPLAELLAAALLISSWRPLGAAGAAGLLCLYATAMAVPLRAGRRLDCGCGGEPLALSWALVLRNMALLPLALLAGLAPQERAMTLGDHALTAAALLLAALLWAAFHQVLRQQRPPSDRLMEKH